MKLFCSWEKLPDQIRNEAVKPYYELLKQKRIQLFIKRLLDLLLSLLLIVFFAPFFLLIAALIKIDSKGKVFFKQTRVTADYKYFKIIKFRTMYDDSKESNITAFDDSRITRFGKYLRKYHLDELPQLFNVLLGDMSFVGTRPEVVKFVETYKPEMFATLLLPAGVTSWASILYKDEEKLFEGCKDIDDKYISVILPDKMKYNLDYLKKYSIWNDIKIIIYTFFSIIGFYSFEKT